MKLMIASDLHGSLHYCEKMAVRYEVEKPEKLILLGDLLYHGPRNELPRGYDPKGVFELLNGMKDKLLCVRGNCDAAVDQMVLDFPIEAEYILLYLDGVTVFATHGERYNEQTPPPIGRNDVLLHGHTHISVAEDTGGFILLNPGSTSLPKDGYHSYMVYEDGVFTVKTLRGSTLKCIEIGGGDVEDGDKGED